MYDTDVTDEQWLMIEDLFWQRSPKGLQPKTPPRQMFNALLYIAKTGCQWRMLPKDFPNWQAVYSRYRCWSKKGVFEQALQVLNITYRIQNGKPPEPSMGIIDSQSLKTSNTVNKERGVDGGKKNKRPQKTYSG